MNNLGRAVINRAVRDIWFCHEEPHKQGDDYLTVRPSEWNHALALLLSYELEWKRWREFLCDVSDLNTWNELEVQLEALVGWAYHSIHEAGCQATLKEI